LAPLACVCLALALWMTGSRPAAGLHARSLSSGSRWDQAYFNITDQALHFRQTGDLRSAERVYQQGLDEATRRNDALGSVRFVMSIGGCRLMLSEYRSALAAFLDARKRATDIQDTVDLGGIAVNLSSIYLQMWDIQSAQRAAEQGLESVSDTPSAYFAPQLFLQVGRIHAMQRDGQAESFYIRGMRAARINGDQQSEARGWDWIGDEQFARDEFAAAEKSYLEAYRLRTSTKSAEIGFSYGRLGALRLAQGNLDEAENFTKLAAQAGKLGWPEYLMRHQQGSIHLARGQVTAALEDFSQAIESTIDKRLNVLPSRASLTASNIGLEDKIYRSFIELAADQAVLTANPTWTSRSFQALELNRAASLRESLALANVWREKLPSEYWETVGKMEAAQAKYLLTGNLDRSIPSLRLRITELEAAAGLSFAVKKGENFLIQTSLNHFQAGLQESEIFLSFFLGRDSSYLWAVTREGLHIYRLAPERAISADIAAFREALREKPEKVGPPGFTRVSNPTGLPSRTEWERLGARLYMDLFGSLDRTERSKERWLLSLEGTLFDVPFAALVEHQDGGQATYMVEKHSIQEVPGALLLRNATATDAKSGKYLGLGDPVYNAADSRWKTAQLAGWRWMASTAAMDRAGQLTRLAASSDEIRASARTWERHSGTATLLEGFDAGRDNFLRQLTFGPSVIHLATHVLFAPAEIRESSREQAFIAFSIPRTARNEGPDYLTTARISTLHVPGALVVMTGCATGTGESRAGAGLLGLTRAWLMAGASGVLSTAWPVEDSTGEIFSRFYQYYPDMPAAEALRRSQVEMSHRTAPAQWASYQLTGGLR
jgi:tetratricopeptide (TPR) repeat protein